MKVSKEEILHIANLANLTLEENEIDNYLENLEEILNNYIMKDVKTVCICYIRTSLRLRLHQIL